MTKESADDVRRALVALAEMCSSGDEKTAAGSIPLDWFRWLPVSGLGAFIAEQTVSPTLLPHGATGADPRADSPMTVDRAFGDQLAAVNSLRASAGSLRVGWLFVAGRTDVGGRKRKVFQPLLSRAVSARRPVVGAVSLVPRGDLELTSLVTDPAARASFEQHVEVGGGAFVGAGDVAIDEALLRRMPKLRDYAVRIAAAAGLPAGALVPAGSDPDDLVKHDGLVVVAGLAVYLAVDTDSLSRPASLRTWADRKLDTWTAFHSLYADGTPPAPRSSGSRTTESPFLLTPVQRSAVEASRTAPVTVIRGAPGTGKSHTVTAIACDSLARGETVLLAAKSEATVDALIDLFEQAPGPRPIVFGSNERKAALAAHLAGGLHPCDDDAVERAARNLDEAVADRDERRRSIVERLRVEALAERPHATDHARRTWPSLFELDADLDATFDLVADASAPPTSWRANRRRRRATLTLDERSGARTDAERADFVHALVEARAARQAVSFVAGGGLVIGDEWEELRAADERAHQRAAEWLDLETHSARRLTRSSLGEVSALATALRSGRAARRAQLANLDDQLTRALPLWAGTLADIDDLLPTVAGLFDLVILDEASSIDQTIAASALLRGRRAVIVGDPKQLRHVSFLADEQRDQALATAGVDPSSALASRLDVRRNSTFDVASGVAPVLTLDEHFRCRPHLVEFVAHRLYDGQVHVATRSPATASVDCVELQRVEGTRDKDGVVRDEVAAVIARLRELHGTRRSIGVVSPFRAQADALEAAILGAFTVDQIEAMDLRVGTVHAFQGNERDIVIASLGIGPGAAAGSWRFVEDPHLFTVLVTRAREQFVIVHAADPKPGGLVADYLAQADAPPGPPAPRGEADEWTAEIARHLRDTHAELVCGYPTGRHQVDLCVGDASSFYGLECSVHPDGPDAHIDRHLALARRGWDLRDAYPSCWSDRVGELIVDLATPSPPARTMRR